MPCPSSCSQQSTASAKLVHLSSMPRQRTIQTLGDLVGHIDRLEVRCRHCERYGRVRLAKLIEEHGASGG
jgi:hypothetical protein